MPGPAHKGDPTIYSDQQGGYMKDKERAEVILNDRDLEAGRQKEGLEVKIASRHLGGCFSSMSWKSAAIGFLLGATAMFLFGVLPLVAHHGGGERG